MLKEMKPYYLGNVIAANDLDVIRVAVPTSYALPHCVVVEAKFGHCLAGTKLKGIAKKKNATIMPKLTEGEVDLLDQMQGGYELVTDSLGGNPVLRS